MYSTNVLKRIEKIREKIREKAIAPVEIRHVPVVAMG